MKRSELAPRLHKAGLPVESLPLGQLLIHAELDGLICSGPRQGKQFTYALLDERVPRARTLARDEALAELAKRYFRSHGPATAQDFAWWSGLTVSEARSGLESVKSQLEQEELDDQIYWFAAFGIPANPVEKAWLLPNYDEYTVGYKNRNALLDAAHSGKLQSREGVLAQSILSEGRIVGMWKRTLQKQRAVVQLLPFTELGKTRAQHVMEAATHYGEFMELAVELVM